jgi:hypothetical protein
MGDQSIVFSEILHTIETYISSLSEPDGEKLRSVFHPDSQLFGVFGGKPVVLPIDAWIERVTGDPKPAPDAKLSPPPADGIEWRIESIEVKETIARVEVVSRFLEVWYTDYITLLQGEGGWSIVNKTFTYEKA